MECNAINCIYYQQGSCTKDTGSWMEVAEELVPGDSVTKRITLRNPQGCYCDAVNLRGHCPDFQSQ